MVPTYAVSLVPGTATDSLVKQSNIFLTRETTFA
jgi:hypothetical protein